MNKKALQIISKFSQELPAIQYTAAIYNSKISGTDVLLAGTKQINGEDVDTEKQYSCKTPLIRDIDHKKRMKRIYNKRGKIGLITYLKPFCKKDQFGRVQVFIMNSIP